jgi:transcriptional regulator NrdR
VRRRRECERCGQRFSTFEKAQLLMPGIAKRSKGVEPFKEDKLRRGIESACFKRPVTPEQIDHALDSVMRKLRVTGEREVPSRQVGEWVIWITSPTCASPRFTAILRTSTPSAKRSSACRACRRWSSANRN